MPLFACAVQSPCDAKPDTRIYERCNSASLALGSLHMWQNNTNDTTSQSWSATGWCKIDCYNTSRQSTCMMLSPPTPPSFVTARDRDASDTIRGYVYQVDLSIARWLALQPSQVLELERGEDIDLTVLVANAAEQKRLLEQAKCYKANLTLRSSEALEALAAFVEHRMANPGLSLLFRYTTTASVGYERGAPLPDGLSGIAAWEMVRTGTCPSELQQRILTDLRGLLRKARCPADLNKATWTTFMSFVQDATDEEFLALIQAMEWGTHAPSSSSLSVTIQTDLLARRYAANLQHARAQYHQLFFHVFKVLTQPNIKRLTHEDLTAQLAIPALNETDRALREVLGARLDAVDVRLAELEMTTGHYGDTLQTLTTQLRRTQGIVATLGPSSPLNSRFAQISR